MRRTKEQKTNRGITLIALVITIIVMLVLVGVTIAMAVNGGLFDYAGKAVSETRNAISKEQELANLKANMTVDELIDQYTGTEEGGQLPTYTEASFQDGYLTENASFTSGGYTAIIPKGFKISEVEGEGTIITGLVIKDAKNNEFVWIPVTKTLENSYSYAEGYVEPAIVASLELGYDFTSEYNAMVTSVNNNDGFYLGRYETTWPGYDETTTNIGTVYGDTVKISTSWYELYEAQKVANVEGNGTRVQTAMVYGVLWDEAMSFITQYDSDYNINKYPVGAVFYTQIDSTSSSSSLNESSDIALNIYGLGSNRAEWTQESLNGSVRIVRGGITKFGCAGDRVFYFNTFYKPVGSYYFASRMVMYIL